MNTDPVAQLLEDIRDAVRETHARLDQTAARLDEIDAQLDATSLGFDELSHQVVAAEIRTGAALAKLTQNVRELVTEAHALLTAPRRA